LNFTRAFLFAMVLAAPTWAQGFDAAGFFGAYYTADESASDAGSLHVALDDTPPAWVDFSGSGPGRAQSRFVPSNTGLVITPDDEHGTCEALLDLGVSRLSGHITVVELDRGGAFAWHLRDLADAGRAWLVELKHEAGGEFELRVRARDGGRYVAIPGATRAIADLSLPAEFKLEFAKGTVTGSIGDVRCTAGIDVEGVSVGLAVTDERARVRDLELEFSLHATWIEDATARLEARRNLERLREYATTGLLSGINQYPHPELEQTLKTYSVDERRDRDTAKDAQTRADTLDRIAAAHANSSAAQHEAGLALLISGRPAGGHARLVAADKLKRTPVTSLALAEACRRVGDIDAAQAALDQAGKDLPAALQPDYALVEGRLLADRGDIAGAERVLRAARDKFSGRAEIDVFAGSAAVLIEPPTLRASGLKGPLGLKLISDLDDAVLQPLLNQLGPYVERIRLWLPDLGEELSGVVAIFNSPVDYLNAALLVAGENVDNVAGMYLAHGIGGGPSVMACRAFGEDELLRTLVHELWHLALAAGGRAQNVPRWLNEGMAVFLSAGVVDRGAMTYKELPSEFIPFADAPLTLFTADRLKAALAAKPTEFYVPGNVRGNYLAGWGVVWYYACARPNAALLHAMLKGDAEAYRGINADVESLHKLVTAALETGIK
jgi:tetratricopeptide (TPR) repeat protein